MAWFTTFGAVNMANPLMGDLENDQFFGRADFTWLSGKQIDFHYAGSARDFIFRGDFSTNVIGSTGEIVDGTFRSLTLATSNQVTWTLTGLPNYSILDALDRASHVSDPGDNSPNYPINVMLLAGNDRIDDASALGNTLNGYAGVDTIIGGAGADIIDGGTSIDQMIGGLNNDTYFVDNSSDQVVELPGEGTDIVQSSATYVLGDSVENLTLIGTGTIDGRGNGAVNTMLGNTANNLLIGRGGNDSLNGGGGDDTLEGSAGNDILSGATGSDTASFLHAGKAVTVDLTITGAQNTGAGNDTLVGIENLIGSQFNDSLKGGATGSLADNVLEGGRGDDTLNGAGGSDTASYAHAKSAVTVTLLSPGVGQLVSTTEGTDTLQNIENLTGGSFGDSLTGSDADNVLDGGLGVDTLTGGLGADTFVFGNVSNNDVIADFSSGVDEIVVLEPTFVLDADGPGIVLPDEFVSGAGKTFPDNPEQHFVYNTTNGALYYYQFGSSGGGTAFATLTGAPTLVASDIHAG